jgi:hypothetical protein
MAFWSVALGLAALVVISGCLSSSIPDEPVPQTITEDFFPLTLGSWWDFSYALPGFPDKPLLNRFQIRAPDANGLYPVLIRILTIQRGIPSDRLAFQRVGKTLRMYRNDAPVDILRFGARAGDTWTYNPTRPQYRAHLKSISWQLVLGEWRVVAEVHFHAGGLDARITRRFWFARGIGWCRVVQMRPMGSEVDSSLVGFKIRDPARQALPPPPHD